MAPSVLNIGVTFLGKNGLSFHMLSSWRLREKSTDFDADFVDFQKKNWCFPPGSLLWNENWLSVLLVLCQNLWNLHRKLQNPHLQTSRISQILQSWGLGLWWSKVFQMKDQNRSRSTDYLFHHTYQWWKSGFPIQNIALMFQKMFLFHCIGLVGAFSTTIGMLLSGWIMKKIKMIPPTAALFYSASIFTTLLGLLALMLIPCPRPTLAGTQTSSKLVYL